MTEIYKTEKIVTSNFQENNYYIQNKDYCTYINLFPQKCTCKLDFISELLHSNITYISFFILELALCKTISTYNFMLDL